MSKQTALRCVGGPMHGKVIDIGDSHTQLTDLGTLGSPAAFAGGLDESPSIERTTVTYARRLLVWTGGETRRRAKEEVLVPESLSEREARRLWLTLPPDQGNVMWDFRTHGPYRSELEAENKELRRQLKLRKQELERRTDAAKRAQEKASDRLRRIWELEDRVEEAHEALEEVR